MKLHTLDDHSLSEAASAVSIDLHPFHHISCANGNRFVQSLHSVGSHPDDPLLAPIKLQLALILRLFFTALIACLPFVVLWFPDITLDPFSWGGSQM